MSASDLPLQIGFFLNGGIGRNGEPVERTRAEYPYTFDDYLSYQSAQQTAANDSAYTDRMRQWDHVKYHSLLRKHFGSEIDHWDGRQPVKIEAFVRDYFDKPNLTLVRIWTCCNQANGFEAWQFEWFDGTKPSIAAESQAAAMPTKEKRKPARNTAGAA